MAKGRKTGGRGVGVPNKATAEVKDLAREYGPQAVYALAQLAGVVFGEDGAPIGMAIAEPARVAALNSLLDRAYGKATQPVEQMQIGPDGKPMAPGAVFILKVER